MKPRILILTQAFDPMADRLVVELGYRGVDCVRWHTDTLPATSTLSVRGDTGGVRGALRVEGRTIALEDITAVWNRRQAAFAFPDEMTPDERTFADLEMKAALGGVLRLQDWFWVNHPDRNRVAGSKALQLQAARRLGFEIPRTLISNDPDEVRAFARDARVPVVYKTLHAPFLADTPQAIFTSVVGEEHLAQIDLIRRSGGIFQAYVEKAFELRVIVVGEQIFAAEIRSQEEDGSKIDWRAADAHKLTHKPHILDADVEKKVRRLIRDFGLVYGALDMIVTPDGRTVFLENNPAGQYGWIEDMTGLPITPALADTLIAA